MKLFLTSYLAGTKELVQNFLTQNNVQKILFIPTAANVEEYRDYVDEGIAALKESGYDVAILDVATTPHNKSMQAIQKLCLFMHIRWKYLLSFTRTKKKQSSRPY